MLHHWHKHEAFGPARGGSQAEPSPGPAIRSSGPFQQTAEYVSRLSAS